jgi:putative membrane-bound dehydrogenase-like protein
MSTRWFPILLALVCVQWPCRSAESASQPGPQSWGPARWVWDDGLAATQSQDDIPRYLRRVVELPAKPNTAYLQVTADNHYVAYVNGQKVGEDGNWNDAEVYDVAGRLHEGRNVIALEARNAGAPAGIIAVLHVTMSGQKPVAVGTDPHWTLHKADTPPSPDWLKVDFDDKSWSHAIALGDATIGPWNIAGRSGEGSSSEGGIADVNVTDRSVTTYRPAAEEADRFTLPEGFKIELVAAEPLVINPVCMTLDERGRIYVSESHTYRYGPSGSPVKKPTNPIVRLDPSADGKGLRRVLVTEGFDDPVMGMAIRDGKLWCTANNYLYRFDLDESGAATNRQTLLVDKNKAWNPFGMFVLEWGPDGLLCLSVGNHNIDIHGPTNTVNGRGGSGIIVRMTPDGADLERLVHGLRVPYSFEFDPFGQLWLLSNGEGNPNRFVRVIEGVDYHCYSRGEVDNNWLAGRHPLAPPCFELPGGARTQLVRYYGANFPNAYWGSLLLDNWGRHGFGGANRAVFRYVPDERNNIVQKEPFIVCSDPHFRCSHVVMAPDGGLYLADWYGRDDESDLTGRIWKVTYHGTDAPKVTHTLDSPRWNDDAYAVSALGSPDHLVRQRAMDTLVKRGSAAVKLLADNARGDAQPLGAANALWALARIGTDQSRAAIAAGADHPDWRVRRLAAILARRYQVPSAASLASRLAQDPDPAVRIAAVQLESEPTKARDALVAALQYGAAADPHLRYEAAWWLARYADAATLHRLVQADDSDLRLAGLIAIDVACYENLATKPDALGVLADALIDPGQIEPDLLLTLARIDRDERLAPALAKLMVRQDVEPSVTAQALLLLRAMPGTSGSAAGTLNTLATRRFLDAVRDGAVQLRSNSDVLTLFDLLANEGPTPFALSQIEKRVLDGNRELRDAAHALARRFGVKAAPLADAIWPRIIDPRHKTKWQDKLELISLLTAIEQEPAKDNWRGLLMQPDPAVVKDAVRSWRRFVDQPGMVDTLVAATPALTKDDPTLAEDLGAVFAVLKVPADRASGVSLPKLPHDLAARRAAALASAATPAQPNGLGPALGRRVFERAGCVKCHTTVTQNTPRAPSLQGIGKAQSPEYLVESFLEPSKVIKTGYETERVETTDGETLIGLVKDDPNDKNALLVIMPDSERRLARKDIANRAVQKVSLMPTGLTDPLSQSEVNDLLAYLRSLR